MNYNEYLKHLNPVLKRNEFAKTESEASNLQAYKDQMNKQQLLGEIRESKEVFLNMKESLPLVDQYRLKVFSDYLDNICSALNLNNDKTNEKLARAAYDFLTAQINKLFEDNSKSSQPSFESFSEDVQCFLNHINTYLINNPTACSNSIVSTIKLLKQLDNKRSFNPSNLLRISVDIKKL